MLRTIIDRNGCEHHINPKLVVDILHDKGIEIGKVCMVNGFEIVIPADKINDTVSEIDRGLMGM